MRSEHLKPGHKYYLAGERERIVRVVDTPPESRARARVNVEFVNGVKAGKLTEIPTRRLVAPVAPPEVEPAVRRTRQPQQEEIRFTRRPRLGESVVWKAGTGEDLRWVVTSIDGEIASIETELFGCPSATTVSIDDLRVRPIVKPPPVKITLDPIVLAPDVVLSVTRPPARESRFAPRKARRELDEILDGLVFTVGCLGAYQQRLEPKANWAKISDVLRSEVRTRGYVQRSAEPEQTFGLIRVDRRFDVPLLRKPSPEEFEMIEYLRFWSRPRQRSAKTSEVSPRRQRKTHAARRT
jgi:hypothetical protein